jgi:7-carboxy-7-deazaguanine synthase
LTTTLRVLEIFDSLQGEGCWTGVPMTFVRLAGCNAPGLGLGCTLWCDTPGSWDREAGEELAAADVLRRARLRRLCLTGGEPLLQLEGVAALVAAAHGRGVKVHLETNGTVAPPAPLAAVPPAAGQPPGAGRCFDWAVVSPKPPDYLIAPGWEGQVDELKLVADEVLDAATAERLAAAHPEAVVCIQPEWEQRRRGGAAAASARGAGAVARAWAGAGAGPTGRAVALVMQHPDWRLSLQMHKFLGIR